MPLLNSFDSLLYHVINLILPLIPYAPTLNCIDTNYETNENDWMTRWKLCDPKFMIKRNDAQAEIHRQHRW